MKQRAGVHMRTAHCSVRGKRAKAGFTLVETLVAAAILVAVLAIAIPGMAAVVRSTTMARLDAQAKTVYVSLQTQIINMEADGELEGFLDSLSSHAPRLAAAPADYAKGDDGWSRLRCVSSEDECATALRNRMVAVDGVMSGSYLIEIDERTGQIYGVLYADGSHMPLSYECVSSLPSRSQEDRYACAGGPVGYYRAGSFEVGGVPGEFSPHCRFVNGNELYLNIICMGSTTMRALESGMKVFVDVSDGSSLQTLTLQGGRDFDLDEAGNLNIDVVFDSMREGLGARDILPSLDANRDLTARVRIEYSNGSGVSIVTPQDKQPTACANGLFAQVENGCAEIGNVRHLNNMRFASEGIESFALVSNVDFDVQTWPSEESTSISAATCAFNTDQYGSAYVSPLDSAQTGAQAFEPVDFSALAAQEFDGRGNEIRGLNVASRDAAGLFARIGASQVISDVILVDPQVASAQSSAGALVGQLDGMLAKCGARISVDGEASTGQASVDAPRVSGVSGVGGLVGCAQGSASLSECFAALDVAGRSDVGGLVGQWTSSSSIERSYASGGVAAASHAGGLVGSVSSGSLTACYATGAVSSEDQAGGLVGQASYASASQCRSYGKVNSAGNAAGLVGSQAQSRFVDCAYLVQAGYNERVEAVDGIEARSYGQLCVGSLSEANSHPYQDMLQGMPFPFEAVQSEHWGDWPPVDGVYPSLVYFERYGDGSVGYYGTFTSRRSATRDDIVVDTLDDQLPVSEDGYALLCDDTVDAFSYTLNGGEKRTVHRSAAPSDDSCVALDASRLVGSRGSQAVDLSRSSVLVLPFDVQVAQSASEEDFYSVIEFATPTAGGKDVHTSLCAFNPHFAKCAINPSAEEGALTYDPHPTIISIRTPRHINALGRYQRYWDAKGMGGVRVTYKQERDIAFKGYANVYCGRPFDLLDAAASNEWRNRPIGTAQHPFEHDFDGTGHVIEDFRVVSDDVFVGLFGSVSSGTIANVHMVASADASAYAVCEYAGADAASVGVLAGRVGTQAKVSNCSVAEYAVTHRAALVSQAGSAGGLVGYNEGSIDSCSAACASIEVESPSDPGAALCLGGLVGSNAGVIVRSYAGGWLFCGTSDDGEGRVISYGGIAGRYFGVSEGKARIDSCYAFCTAGLPSCGARDTKEFFGVAHPEMTSAGAVLGSRPLSGYGLVSCYYLNAALPGDMTPQGGTGALACTSSELSRANLAGFGRVRETFYPGSRLVEQSFPYPGVVKDGSGTLVHFGLWAGDGR